MTTEIEWEVDEHGRWFRRVGRGCIEYERTIGDLPAHTFFARQEAEREAAERRRAEEQAEAVRAAELRRNCPFRDSNGDTDCTREKCALFADGCTLSRTTPTRDTAGLQCPINRYRLPCRTDCALFRDGGCTF